MNKNFKTTGNEMKKRMDGWMLWLRKHSNTVIPMLCVVVLVLVGVIVFLAVKKPSTSQTTVVDSGLLAGGAEPQSVAEEKAIEVPTDPMEENAYEEVNQLVAQYFAALADGAVDTVASISDNIDGTERILIQKKSERIESYDNLVCYTKKGPIDNSYLVFAYTDMKFVDVEGTIPALKTLFVCPNEEGRLYIFFGNTDNNVTKYLQALCTQEDVSDLFNRVQVQYNEILESNEALNTLMATWPTEVKEAAATEIANANAGEQEATAETGEVEESTEAESEPAETVAAASYVKAIDNVNVRSSDSEVADKLGTLTVGSIVERLEVKENGWTKIKFEGQDGYCKTEYLEETQAAAVEDAGAATVTGQTITVKDTVNIRASAGENGDKLGVAYQGETFDVIMRMEDGWVKIDYNGESAYLKEEYVDFN